MPVFAVLVRELHDHPRHLRPYVSISQERRLRRSLDTKWGLYSSTTPPPPTLYGVKWGLIMWGRRDESGESATVYRRIDAARISYTYEVGFQGLDQVCVVLVELSDAYLQRGRA